MDIDLYFDDKSKELTLISYHRFIAYLPHGLQPRTFRDSDFTIDGCTSQIAHSGKEGAITGKFDLSALKAAYFNAEKVAAEVAKQSIVENYLLKEITNLEGGDKHSITCFGCSNW